MKNGNIKLVSTDTGSSRLLQPTSEARLRLAKLIDRRLTIESKLRHLGDATAKLQEAADAEGNARAAFNALDSEETQAMAAWSKSSGPKPVIDRTRREKLKADLEDAAASARRLAEAGCSANVIAAISGHKSLSEVERYTIAANQERMARMGVDTLMAQKPKGEQESVKPVRRFDKKAK
jgi:hypothetical protein